MGDTGQGGQASSLKEVAEMAGTSTATVSRVLSNKGPVSAALRERVLDAVRETGYVPNVAASALARRRSLAPGVGLRTVAFAIAASGTAGLSRTWEETCEGVLEAADEMGVNVTVCLVGLREAEEGRPPPALVRAPVDGILAGLSKTSGANLLPRIAPTVLVGSAPVSSSGLPVVEADHEEGIRRLVGHLADLGHTKVEYVPWTLNHQPYRLRGEAFLRAAEQCGLRPSISPPVQDKVPEYIRTLLARPSGERPTALVACSDGVAVQALHALLAEGVLVPQEISVVGFDGRPWGAESAPPLTSWRVHWRAMGRIALQVLADLLRNGAAPTRTLVGGELVVRGSAAPPLPEAVHEPGDPMGMIGEVHSKDPESEAE